MSKEPALNGCHNRKPLQRTVQVQDGWTWTQAHYGHDGAYVPQQRKLITIRTPWDSNCHYDRKAQDERCKGCRWMEWSHDPAHGRPDHIKE